MKINKKLAKNYSYGSKRDLNKVFYIVIHYTGNKGDTAKGNANFFADGNRRNAGAHFFVDSKEVWQSVSMNLTAWSVGGDQRSGKKGEATYYGRCTNANSISIELCDCINDATFRQLMLTRKLVKHIRKYCPNAKTIIRHWDVNGKACPASMCGVSNKRWDRVRKLIDTGNYSFKAKVTKTAAVRIGAGITNSKIDTLHKGNIVHVKKLKGNWALIDYDSCAGACDIRPMDSYRCKAGQNKQNDGNYNKRRGSIKHTRAAKHNR